MTRLYTVTTIEPLYYAGEFIRLRPVVYKHCSQAKVNWFRNECEHRVVDVSLESVSLETLAKAVESCGGSLD